MTITIKLRINDHQIDPTQNSFNVAFRLAEQVAILSNQQGFTNISSFDVLVDKQESYCENKTTNMFLQRLLKKSQNKIVQKDPGQQPGS